MFTLQEDLKQYKGSNNKPNDFDAYWQRALQLLEQHDPKVTIQESDIHFEGVTCYDLQFEGVGGSLIYAKYMKPHKQSKSQAILQFHGYMYHSGSWSEKLAYTSQGYSVFAMECRGQGGRSQDIGHFDGTSVYGHLVKGLCAHEDELYYKYVFLDSVLLSRIVLQMEGITSLYTMGLSQGGGLSIVCAALVKEVKKVAIQNPFLSDYEKVYALGLAREPYRLNDYFRLFDPLHKQNTEIFRKLGYIDTQYFAPNVKANVLFGCGLKDAVCPTHAQMAIYNNLSGNKKLKLYPDYEHEDMPGFWDTTIAFFNQEVI